MNILAATQSKWGTWGTPEASGQEGVAPMVAPESAPASVPEQEAAPAIMPEHEQPPAPDAGMLQPLDVDYPDYDPGKPGCSCFECGLKLVGRISEDPEHDCARLEEIVRKYPIRPHRHEGGGSGFAYPHEDGWHSKHSELTKEFSELWFTAAGDLYISRHWRKMLVVPRDQFTCPVHVDRKGVARLPVGTSRRRRPQGSGQA